MKKISAIVISVVLLFMLTASASADVRRGDRGEDVEEIQTLLFQMGWLFEEPDGIFGPHTEQAVINYQGYSGLTQDGVVDKATYDRMWEDWHYLFYDDGTPHNHGEDWDGDGILEVEPDDESMALLHNFPRPDDNPPEAESEAEPPVPEEREGQQQIQEDETKAAAPEKREELVQTQETETNPAVSDEREGQQTQESETNPAVSEEREGLQWTKKAETDQMYETEGPEPVQTIETGPVETEAFTEAMPEEETEELTEKETEGLTERKPEEETEELTETETEKLTEPEPEETETEELTETETEELTETETEETETEETESEEIPETESEKPEQPEGWSLGKVLEALGSAPEQLMDSVSSIKDQFGFGRK